jgi:hypothetical protein
VHPGIWGVWYLRQKRTHICRSLFVISLELVLRSLKETRRFPLLCQQFSMIFLRLAVKAGKSD